MIEQREVASGLLVAGRAATGTFHPVAGVEDVLALLRRDDLDEIIVFVEEASVSNIAPILGRVRGVLSTAGGPNSHLAIVTRGFETTCVVGATFAVEPATLGGKAVEVRADGTIALVP